MIMLAGWLVVNKFFDVVFDAYVCRYVTSILYSFVIVACPVLEVTFNLNFAFFTTSVFVRSKSMVVYSFVT